MGALNVLEPRPQAQPLKACRAQAAGGLPAVFHQAAGALSGQATHCQAPWRKRASLDNLTSGPVLNLKLGEAKRAAAAADGREEQEWPV